MTTNPLSPSPENHFVDVVTVVVKSKVRSHKKAQVVTKLFATLRAFSWPFLIHCQAIVYLPQIKTRQNPTQFCPVTEIATTAAAQS